MKNLLLAFLTCTTIGASAQEFPYSLTTFTAPYESLSEATSLTPTDDPDWDDPGMGYYLVPIGFEFDLMGRSSEFLVVVDPGCQVALGDIEADTVNLFSPYYADVRNADSAEVVSGTWYATEGVPGSRIFKLEWNNVGFYNEYFVTGEFESTSNFQVWLYETTNDIEFRYGPNTIVNPELIYDEFGSPFIFFTKNFVIQDEVPEASWNLRGDPSGPTVGLFDLFQKPSDDEMLTGEPADGQVYHFDTGIVGVTERPQATFSLYPTVAHEHLNLQWPDANTSAAIFDITGNRIMDVRIQHGLQQLDVSTLAKGVYFIRVNTGEGRQTTRFVKE